MNSIIGIVAEKLGHSLSPNIHNYWSKKYKQKLQYQKFEISEKNLTKFFQAFKKNKKFNKCKYLKLNQGKMKLRFYFNQFNMTVALKLSITVWK